MNLCHCSKSSCSACGLPAGSVCECLATKKSGPCKVCPENEKALHEMTKRESDATKTVAAQQRELTELKKKLADERAKLQSEREAKKAQDAALNKMIEELGQKLASGEPSRAVQERMAELEKAAHRAINMEAASATKCKVVEQQLAGCRDELVDLRERTKRAEAVAATANEAQQQHAAEHDAAAKTEKRLRQALAAAEAERDALKAEATGSAGVHARLEEAEAARDDFKGQVAKLAKQLEKDKENALAYEGAIAESRGLKAKLDEASALARRATALADEQQAKADALAAERTQLQTALAHAERVRELFQTVTSRTNQVQDAANEVIASVAARKRAQAEQELRDAELGADAPSGETMIMRGSTPAARHVVSAGGEGYAGLNSGGVARTPSSRPSSSAPGGPLPVKPREGWTAGPASSPRGPLQAKQQLAASSNGQANIKPPWPPQPPLSARTSNQKGLPPGRQGVRSVLTPR